ncbi:RNA guanine-N7 methyltransferase activating subunit [Diachasma alloeum]|uniref:RNA guanine-N7 methyltransferase activating subunit n=1 Tax=Diachasma alloeum TaxID=454923 RepID=UPI00073846AE|nr:RNA guanine-N7 methyltransferase activating subunit [Diachasma alloeum]
MGKQFLSEEQESFLESSEEEFKYRYTDDDAEFVKYMNTERAKPPIVDPWYNKPRRPQFDWRQGKRRDWDNRDRRNNDRYERNDRSDRHGRHHMSQRKYSRPY